MGDEVPTSPEGFKVGCAYCKNLSLCVSRGACLRLRPLTGEEREAIRAELDRVGRIRAEKERRIRTPQWESEAERKRAFRQRVRDTVAQQTLHDHMPPYTAEHYRAGCRHHQCFRAYENEKAKWRRWNNGKGKQRDS